MLSVPSCEDGTEKTNFTDVHTQHDTLFEKGKANFQESLPVHLDGIEEDTIQLSDVVSTNSLDEITVHLGKVITGPTPTRVVIELRLQEGKITWYDIITSSRPIPKKDSQKQINYTIQKGDTRNKIAQKFGIPISSIRNKEPIQPGQKLIVE